MRLIDADKLQGQICKEMCECRYEECEGGCDYDHFISSAPSMDAQALEKYNDQKKILDYTCSSCRWRVEKQKCGCCIRNQHIKDYWEESK